jgi:hypothetical protein
MNNLVPKILGWVTVIVALALAPSINTANTAIDTAWAAATNNATMIGMGTVVDFGAPIMVIGLLFSGGLLAMGKVGDGTIKGMMGIIGACVVTIVVLNIFPNVITYVDTLISASTGFAQTVYGVFPIILYIGIIAGAGVTSAVNYFRGRGKKKKVSAMAGGF